MGQTATAGARKRPVGVRRLGLALLLLVGAGLVAPHLWAWYHLQRGRQALDLWHTDAARGHLDRCLRVWPRSTTAHRLAARAARRVGDLDEAERHLDLAAPGPRAASPLARPGPDDPLLEWAMLRAARGDLASCEDFLRTVAEKDARVAPLAWEALADGYSRMYRGIDAHRCLDEWLRLDPDSVGAHLRRADLHRKVNAIRKATDDYRRVLELDPDQDAARWWLALGLHEVGRYDEAASLLEETVRRHPDDLDAQAWLARVRARTGRSDEARAALEAILVRQPGHLLALRFLGQVALAAGDPAAAEKPLAEAARAAPFDYQVQWALYDCLRQTPGRDADAARQRVRADDLKDRLERLSEITSSRMPVRPLDADLHAELGALLLTLGHQDMGERWLLSALELRPDHRPACATLAAYYEGQGDAAQAQAYRARAGDAGPVVPGPPAR